MRIALLTLEAASAEEAVRAFIAADPARIALVGLSNVYRPREGSVFRQALKHFRRSGPRIFPYLAASFFLPDMARLGRRMLARFGGPALRSLASLCADLGLPATPVDDVNSPEFRRKLADSGADLLLTFHFDQILSAETIAAARLGGLNIHAGLLPSHRGPTPTIHALLEDVPMFGVTVQRLAPGIDFGAILAQQRCELPTGTSAAEAAERLHAAAVPLLERVLRDLAAGRLEERTEPPLPYCGWPSWTQMRRLGRLGRRGANFRDFTAPFFGRSRRRSETTT